MSAGNAVYIPHAIFDLSTSMVNIPNLRFITVPITDFLFSDVIPNDPHISAEKTTMSPISIAFKTKSRFPSFVFKVSKELMRSVFPFDFMMKVEGKGGGVTRGVSKKIIVRCIT